MYVTQYILRVKKEKETGCSRVEKSMFYQYSMAIVILVSKQDDVTYRFILQTVQTSGDNSDTF